VILLLLILIPAAILAGGIAAISGFGIGSLLTPLLAIGFGTKTAVLLVSLPTRPPPACGSGSCAGPWIDACC